MRILLVSDNYLPNRDGVTTSVVCLARGLRELGHDTAILAPRATATRAEAGERLYLAPSVPTRYGDYRFAWPLPGPVSRAMRSFRPDVVHIQTFGPLGLLAAAHCQDVGLPKVLTWHTDLFAYRRPYPALNFAIPISWAAWSLRRASKRAVVAKSQKRQTSIHSAMLSRILESFPHIIVPSTKAGSSLPTTTPEAGVHIIPSAAIPPGALDGRAQLLLSSLLRGMPTGSRVVVFVGRLSSEKNVEFLLRSMRYLLDHQPEARLNVLGDGPRRADLKRLAGSLGIAGSVNFAGAIPRELVSHVIMRCNVMAHTSRSDTQGMVLDEAAQVGVPAVVLDSALNGVVRHGHSGYVAESESSFGPLLTELFAQSRLRDLFGEHARRIAEANTPAHFAERVANVYSQAIQMTGSPQTEWPRKGR